MTTCEINFRYHTVVIVPTKSTALAREIKSGMNHGTSSRYLYPTFVKFFLHQTKTSLAMVDDIAILFYSSGYSSVIYNAPERKISSVQDGKISFERKMLSRNSSNANMWSSAVVVSV